MKIVCTKRNGGTVMGECVMLDRDGNVYECIDNAYHPNPGTEDTGYDEIERTVDWLYQNKVRSVYRLLDLWIAARVQEELEDTPSESLESVIYNVMFCDLYTPCDATKSAIRRAYESRKPIEYDSISLAGQIAHFLNNKFLRVRAGGKLNPEGSDSIYFRISSKGYDWHPVIIDFLWDTFGDPDAMPSYIWIGHDAETNPPEVTLFEGSPKDLLEKYDEKIFANNEIVWL